jgi:osmotically-inducible protein OsmY
VRRAVVALDGFVLTEVERDMAEWDAWYVFGVEDVLNRIEVKG